MCQWKFWGNDLCHCCGISREDTNHLFHCEDPGMQAIQFSANATLEHDLYCIGVVPQLVPLFVKTTDDQSNIQTTLNVEIFQAFQIQKLIGCKWTTLGLFSKEWHRLLNRYKHQSPLHCGSPKRWLKQIIMKQWETTWDLWRYQNGVVHSWETTLEKEFFYKKWQMNMQRV